MVFMVTKCLKALSQVSLFSSTHTNKDSWRQPPCTWYANFFHPTPECKCNGHAQSCHFDWTAWRESGQRSGGVCDCLHNTEGRQCQRCKVGFYRDPRRPRTAPDSCKRKLLNMLRNKTKRRTSSHEVMSGFPGNISDVNKFQKNVKAYDQHPIILSYCRTDRGISQVHIVFVSAYFLAN